MRPDDRSPDTGAAPRLSRAERRRTIEGAALALFARQGYTATTVEEIVTAAGVTKPMLYRSFDSKQELCIALLERYRAELVLAPLDAFDPATGDRRGQMRGMLAAWLDHARANPDATRLLFVPITGDTEVARVQQQLHARQRATQVALLREFAPALPTVLIEPMGEVVRVALAGVVLWWLEHPDAARDDLVTVLERMIDGLIGDSPPGVRPGRVR